jgi:hypothetical protein
MPRTPPLKFKVTPEEKVFIYNTLKKLSSILISDGNSTVKARKDLIKLALKFPPGNGIVYLQDWEREVIVQWLLKLHNLAKVRDEKHLTARFKKVIDIFK